MLSFFFTNTFFILVGKCLIFVCKVAIFDHQVVDFRDLMSENWLGYPLLFKFPVSKCINLNIVFSLDSSKSVAFCSRKQNFFFCM
jgi:hypothetical protein